MISCTHYLMAFGGCPFSITEGSNHYPQIDVFPTVIVHWPTSTWRESGVHRGSLEQTSKLQEA